MPKTKTRTPPKLGSAFKKDYQGITYSLMVVEQKGRVLYRLQGETFNSPTAAAKSLTKHAVNGWLFWKMDKS
jgi:hypothetical protein